MTNIYLSHGETTPSDIKLRDPTAVATSSKVAVPVLDLGTAPTGRTVYYQSLFIPLPPIVAVATAVYGWLSPLSIPLPSSSPATHVNQTDIYFTPTLATGWQSQSSGAPKPAQAQQGYSSVPFFTPSLATGWQSLLSLAPPVAKAQQGNSFVPFNTAQVSVNFTTFGWYQALSVAVPVSKAVAFWTVVPFDTTQPPDIEGMAWWMPLGVVPYSVVYAPQQYIVAPPQFGEIAPSTPAEVATVGGTRRHRHITRREWEELLEEIRLEQEALLAPSRAKAALAAVLKAKRAAAEVATQLERAEAEILAREIVAAERAAKAVEMLQAAQAALAMIKAIEARMDEDDDDIVMLLLS